MELWGFGRSFTSYLFSAHEHGESHHAPAYFNHILYDYDYDYYHAFYDVHSYNHDHAYPHYDKNLVPS